MHSRDIRRCALPSVILLLLILAAVEYLIKPRPQIGANWKPERSLAGDGQLKWIEGFPWPEASMSERMENALRTLSSDERQSFLFRMQADRPFFESIRNLPEDQRREIVWDYFAANPLPLGMDQ